MSVTDLNNVQDMRPHLRSSTISFPEEHITTFDMGWLIPFQWLYNVPGDRMNIGHTPFVRFDPFVNPILSSVKGKIYDFQVPRRIFYNEREFEKYYTGGVNGEYDDKVLPHFTFKNFYKFCYNVLGSGYGELYGGLFGFNTLCDYVGMPVNQLYVEAVVDPDSGEVITPAHFMDPDDVLNEDPVNIEIFLAYALIYREFFLWNHDETSPWVTNKYLEDFTKIPFTLLDDLVDSTSPDYDADFAEFMYIILSLQRKGWQHDYFTSALPNIQAGDPATLGSNSTLTLPDKFSLSGKNTWQVDHFNPSGRNGWNLYGNNSTGEVEVRDQYQDVENDFFQLRYIDGEFDSAKSFNVNWLGKGELPLSSQFTINDIRLLNAIQVLKERQNIGGARLKEFLYMNFGVTVPDDRLDRPDFVGFQEFPVQISEVLQTSQTTDDSVLGDQGGHGIGAIAGQTVFNYFVLEPMISISLICILPDTYYMQGMNPFFNKISRYDEWNPVFNHLSDQALNVNEIYFRPDLASQSEFGYLPRFAEYKCRYNRVSGNFRKIDSGMMSWHQGRLFGTTPQLGQDFINSKPTERVFSVVNNDDESFGSYPFAMDTHCEAHIKTFVRMTRNIPSGSDPSLHID